MKIVLSLALAFTTLLGHSQDNTIKKGKWLWDNPSRQDTNAGYVQVLKVESNRLCPGIGRVLMPSDELLRFQGPQYL